MRRGLAHLAPTLERCPEEEHPAREAQLAKATHWIANVRMVLDAEVQNGKAYTARHSLPASSSCSRHSLPNNARD
jgi:hypothetical protein